MGNQNTRTITMSPIPGQRTSGMRPTAPAAAVNGPPAPLPAPPPAPATSEIPSAGSGAVAPAAPAPAVPDDPAPMTVRSGMRRVPAVYDLVTQIVDGQRLATERFYLVILPDDDNIRVETFESVMELIARIRVFLGTNTKVFPFMGHRLSLMGRPNWHLSTPFGAVPIMSLSDESMIPVEDGFLGEPSRLVVPAGPDEAVAEIDQPAGLGGTAAEDDDTSVLPG